MKEFLVSKKPKRKATFVNLDDTDLIENPVKKQHPVGAIPIESSQESFLDDAPIVKLKRRT